MLTVQPLRQGFETQFHVTVHTLEHSDNTQGCYTYNFFEKAQHSDWQRKHVQFSK